MPEETNNNEPQKTDENVVSEIDVILQQISKEVNYLQLLETNFLKIKEKEADFAPQIFNKQKLRKNFLDFRELGNKVSPEQRKQYIGIINQELSAWRKLIVELEKSVSQTELLLYIEKADPPIHYQILISLARFYFVFKNIDDKRLKFETITMFLFTNESNNQKRELLQNKDEITKTFKELFWDWSKKAPNLPTDSNQITGDINQLRNLRSQINICENIQELQAKNLLNEFTEFKKNLELSFFNLELFPEIIEENVKIGNLIIGLFQKAIAETEKDFVLENQTEFVDQISLAILKNLKISQIQPAQIISQIHLTTEPTSAAKAAKARKLLKPKSRFGVNKWLVAACVGSIFLTLVFNFSFLLSAITQKSLNADGEKVNQTALPNGEYLAEAKIKEETLHLVVKDTWSGLNEDVKKQTAQNIMLMGPETGYSKIVFKSINGEEVAEVNEAGVKIIK